VDSASSSKPKKILGLILAILGVLVIGYFVLRLANSIAVPTISQETSYGLLFVIGLLTGFHCIAMCGGFVLSYSTKNAQENKPRFQAPLLYGLGKLISYTAIGALFGLIGSVVSFTPLIRGIVGIIAGLFLIIYGLNLINLIPWFRNFWIKQPGFFSRFIGQQSQNQNRRPLIIGLLNGLMIACGPLWTIYVMAAGTGSAIEGAKLLFVFGLGTLPVMLGFGLITNLASKKLTATLLKVSGALVIILGLLMLNQGLVLTGTGYDFKSIFISHSETNSQSSITHSVVTGKYQTIHMDVTQFGWQPSEFILKAGIPVKWVINGKEITNCNKAIQVPKLGISFNILPGEQVIEFTPENEGVIPWSCWMGMIDGSFIVEK